MPRGQVKWFDPKKGFGFIIGPEGQDVFVHYSHIQSEGFRTLKDGEEVDYELIQGEKGWQARSVSPADQGGSKPTNPPARKPGPAAGGGYEGADPSASKSGTGYESAE